MKVLIIGAGLSGLGAGKELKKNHADFEILEANTKPGGLAKSDEIKGFLFDCTGHFIHTKTEEGKNDLLRDTIPFDIIKRNTVVNLEGVTFPYPIQYNLRYLDHRTKESIVMELSSRKETEHSFSSLHDFLKSSFGPTLFNIFHEPYNEKLWGLSLKKIPHDVIGRYLPKIDYDLLAKGNKEPIEFTGYNNYFHYPKSGKISCLPDCIADSIKENIVYSKKVKFIGAKNKQVIDDSGTTWEYDYLLSSVPLDQMAEMLNYQHLENTLYSSKIINIRIAFEGDLPHSFHWMYVPEKKHPFYRIGFPKNINPKTSPQGCSSLSVEINQEYLKVPTNVIVAKVVGFLKSNNLIRIKRILFHSKKIISPAYTFIVPEKRKKVNAFQNYMEENNIYTIGRYGNWQYYSMEEAYLSGKHMAKEILEKIAHGITQK